MLRALASFFVAKPANILIVVIVFGAGYFIMRFTSLGTGRHPRALMVAALAWGAYAAWEWLVITKTPDADLRVDLFIIWPVLAMLSGWALYRGLR